MKNTNVFKRKEIKYLITKEQKEALYRVMEEHMEPDAFGNSTIRNIYYDTPDKLLIRRSISKPEYKEKLRVRSYQQADEDSKVFIEIKKKYKGIVYKRRMALEEKITKEYLAGKHSLAEPSQISKEIDYFMEYYGDVEPAIFLAYDREAFFSKEDPNFRMTFDENVIIRDHDISLSSPVYGESDMLKGKVILEVKTVLGIPTWLLDFFSENEIYKTSFSKYGNAYKKYMLPKHLEKKEALSIEKENHAAIVTNSEVSKNRKSIKLIEEIKRAIGIKGLKKAMPLVAVMVLYLSVFANYQYETAVPYSEVYVDVNPSIHFLTNRREEVIGLEADSLEGESIISELDYRGKTIDELTKEILDKMVGREYISVDREYLLLSVDNEDERKAEEGKYYLDKLIHSHLNKSEIQPIVLKQYLNKSEEVEELAEEYNISLSKMTFVRNIVGLNEEFVESELVNLSIAELVDLVQKSNLDLAKIVNTSDIKATDMVAISVAELIELLQKTDEDIGQVISAIDREVARDDLLDISLSELVDQLEKNNLDLEKANNTSAREIKSTDMISLSLLDLEDLIEKSYIEDKENTTIDANNTDSEHKNEEINSNKSTDIEKSKAKKEISGSDKSNYSYDSDDDDDDHDDDDEEDYDDDDDHDDDDDDDEDDD